MDKCGPTPEHCSELGPCWIWTGLLDTGGYGVYGGRKAHRVAWMYAHGEQPIPPTLVICHRCDNRQCVNAQHMFLGTRQENIADCVQKGRNRNGAMAGYIFPGVKLTDEDVMKMRQKYGAGEHNCSQLGREFGVSFQTAWMICMGRMWKRLPLPYDPPKVWPKGLRTECLYGHPYDEQNTYKRGQQGKKCRTCARLRQRRYNAQNRERKLAQRSGTPIA